MAKNKLKIQYDFTFDLLALNANVKSYKLAWAMNKELDLNLVRQDNIALEFKTGRQLSIVNYLAKSEYQKVRLLANRSDEIELQMSPFLIPELKNFDYLILLENESNTFDKNAFLSNTKRIPFIQFLIQVDLHTLKSRDNLIF